MKKILLQNAKIVSSSGVDEKDVVVCGGEILKVCESGEGRDLIENIVDEDGFSALDCSSPDVYVLPGLIDVHVHFREPGLTKKGDFASESRAALAGGITTVFDMPNTVPQVDTYEAFVSKLKIAKEKCLCHFKLFMSGNNVSEIKKVLKDSSLNVFLAGVKVYMSEGVDLENVLADEDLKDVPVVVHAEDFSCLRKHGDRFDYKNPSSHSESRPLECALVGVKKACHLAKKYKRKLHIAHVTSMEEVEIIKKFDNVTFEVSPRHLFLSDELYSSFGHLLKVNPPVRSIGVVGGLWNAVYRGFVDIIASDHSPHTVAEKNGDCPPSGMPEVQTLLPLLLNEVSRGKMIFPDIARLCSERPAEIFGLSNVGKISDGYRADMVLVDMSLVKKVDGKSMFYKCGWSSYDGLNLVGWPYRVILAGEDVSFFEGLEE